MPELDRLFKTLTVLQKEFWDDVAKPKASRRPALAKEYTDTTDALLETLDKLSASLAAAVNHQDATIDQLLAIKQTAWLLRNTAGEASLMISKGLAAGRMAPESRLSLHEIARRHRNRMDRAGNGGIGNAVASGAFRRDRRDQDRLFRAGLSRFARSPVERP